MEDEPQLSSGIIEALLTASPEDNHLWERKHILQVLSLKRVGPSRDGTPDRFRLVVSDGEKYTQAMLATQLSGMVDKGELTKHAVISVDKLTCNRVSSRTLLIFLSISVEKALEYKIGDPASFEMPGQAGDTTVASPAAVTSPTSAITKSSGTSAPAKSSNQKPSGQAMVPIESLSPYQNKWTIKARVVQKSDIRHWSNNKGEGKLFNVTFMDETGEINATGFNQQVDDLYEKLQEGKTYYVSKARVGLAKKKFTTVQNEYEISLSRETEVTECTDPSEAPKIRFHFLPIRDLEQAPKDGFVDVIGVVQHAGEVTEITTKIGKQLKKRELTLVDQTVQSVRLTLWGKQAENYQEADEHPVVAFKGLRVGEFNGRSLSMVNSSMMMVDPDISESHALRGWFDAQGESLQYKSFSSTMGSQGGSSVFRREDVTPLQEVRDNQLGSGDTAETFHCRASIVHIKADNITYPACKTEVQGQKCNKKVVEGPGGWRCEKCDVSWDAPDYRYVLSMSAADWSGQAWLQGFNEAAEIVLGKTANELMRMKDEEDGEARFTSEIAKANCQTFNFTCQAKTETFNDSSRVRYGIRKIHPLNYSDEANYLRDMLKTPWAQ